MKLESVETLIRNHAKELQFVQLSFFLFFFLKCSFVNKKIGVKKSISNKILPPENVFSKSRCSQQVTKRKY